MKPNEPLGGLADLFDRLDRGEPIRDPKLDGTTIRPGRARFLDEPRRPRLTLVPRVRTVGSRAPRRAATRTRHPRCATRRAASRSAGGGSDDPGEPGEPSLAALPERPSVPPILTAVAPDLTGPERLAAFLALDPDEQTRLWTALTDYWHARREDAA